MSETETNKPDDGVSEADELGSEAVADFEAAEAGPEEATGSEPGRRDRGAGFLSSLIPKFAFVVSGLALLISGWLWWQYRQFYVELASDDALLLETLEDTRASLRRLDDEIESLSAALGANANEVDALRNDVEILPAELRALDRRIETLQGGSLDARDIWLREQAEYYLILANTELVLSGSVPSAIAALELADDVLRDLGDLNLLGVRTALAAEIQSLHSIELPDLAGIASTLGGLIRRVPDLPMRAAAPENFGVEDQDLDDVEPGLGRLWARTKGAVTSIVRIERQEETVGPVLTESERRIARRQLELELEIARAASLGARQTDFRAALAAADSILNRDFAQSSQGIAETRELLADLMRIELDPRLPDIGDSLTLLRAAPGGE